MDAAIRYREELDLIFQEIEEQNEFQDQIESEPHAAFVLRLLDCRGMCALLNSVPPEQFQEIIQACVQRRFCKAIS